LLEAEVPAWYDAKTLDKEKTIVRRLNKAALDHAVYPPLGVFMRYQAWRKNVIGIVQDRCRSSAGEQDCLRLASPRAPRSAKTRR
jgi:hypothetical protein